MEVKTGDNKTLLLFFISNNDNNSSNNNNGNFICVFECTINGLGFNGAETNCGIACILGILLMNSCDT